MAVTLPALRRNHGDALSRKAGAFVQAVAAMLLGALVIGMAGFSNLDLVHNAAHDTRHANGLPCH